MKDIKYGAIVPLIGGQVFGSMKVLNKPPEYILSYNAFAGNDGILLDYLASIDKPVPYYNLDIETPSNLPRIDYVTSLCPCAGLSMLNNGKNKGAEGTQNDWMYKSSEYVLEQIRPRVLMGENAPGLFTASGLPVAEKLRLIGEKYGYSMSLIKTVTKLHGIPQNRVRSFFFYWDSKTAPIMNWYNREMPVLEEYMKDIVSSEDDIKLKTTELQTDPLYIWIKGNYPDWRAFMKTYKGSMIDVIISSGNAPAYIEWTKMYFPDHSKKMEHAFKKRSAGMGFWDSSPFLPSVYTGAFTGARMNAIHPYEDRLFTKRELMHFMGLPTDMKLQPDEHMGRVFQNVPSNTSADWQLEIVKYIKGELPFSDSKFVRQDNTKQTIEFKNKSTSLF